MHEHNDCQHALRHCKVCDVVWCEKCHTEWYRWQITRTSGTDWYKSWINTNVNTTTWEPAHEHVG